MKSLALRPVSSVYTCICVFVSLWLYVYVYIRVLIFAYREQTPQTTASDIVIAIFFLHIEKLHGCDVHRYDVMPLMFCLSDDVIDVFCF